VDPNEVGFTVSEEIEQREIADEAAQARRAPRDTLPEGDVRRGASSTDGIVSDEIEVTES
jgi:hypothetical protein